MRAPSAHALLAIGAASGISAGIRDDEPTCMHTTTSASLAASNTGSQYPLMSNIVGRPSGAGFSEKARARAPFAAQRSISAAAATGSHSGMSIIGMYRPGAAPHHSSITQSL